MEISYGKGSLAKILATSFKFSRALWLFHILKIASCSCFLAAEFIFSLKIANFFLSWSFLHWALSAFFVLVSAFWVEGSPQMAGDPRLPMHAECEATLQPAGSWGQELSASRESQYHLISYVESNERNKLTNKTETGMDTENRLTDLRAEGGLDGCRWRD